MSIDTLDRTWTPIFSVVIRLLCIIASRANLIAAPVLAVYSFKIAFHALLTHPALMSRVLIYLLKLNTYVVEDKVVTERLERSCML